MEMVTGWMVIITSNNDVDHFGNDPNVKSYIKKVILVIMCAV